MKKLVAPSTMTMGLSTHKPNRTATYSAMHLRSAERLGDLQRAATRCYTARIDVMLQVERPSIKQNAYETTTNKCANRCDLSVGADKERVVAI